MATETTADKAEAMPKSDEMSAAVPFCAGYRDAVRCAHAPIGHMISGVSTHRPSSAQNWEGERQPEYSRTVVGLSSPSTMHCGRPSDIGVLNGRPSTPSSTR